MKKSVELLDGIIADGAISDTHLRMLVDEIVIYEKNGKLDIQITLRQARIIRTRPKRHIFCVFSLVFFIRRKPYRILRIKIHTKIALVLGRRFFEERIFCRTTSILTETLFSFTVHGTFSVNSGVSASCTKSSYSYSITNKAWELKSASATRSGNKAIANAEFIKKLVFVTVDTFDANIVLACDSNGNLS